MRCSASQTTSTVPESCADSPRAREAAAAFESLLLAQVLRPLAKPLGFLGEAVVDAVAREIASHSEGGALDRIAALLDAAQ